MRDRNKDRNIGYRSSKEVNLKDYFEVIKKRLWIIVLITIICTTAGYYYSNMNNILLYQTYTRIILGAEGDMKTLMVMIKDPIIMEKVKEDLQLSKSPGSIANQIEVARVEDSQVVRISVIDSDPKLAMDIANATAASFKSEISTILDFDEVQLLSSAVESTVPINEGTNRTTIIALVFGLITGIGLVFLLDSLDGTVRKESEVEELLGVPVIGVISNMNKQKYATKKNKQREVKIRSETVDIK
ncbi:YveK family protein [Virgibacillus byunsanensis]|uniref:YveK family protein n=1 Tax=Virgibacillus byunsanensis TaxID=570945 RepID=A0ABW3LQ98_9BACI